MEKAVQALSMMQLIKNKNINDTWAVYSLYRIGERLLGEEVEYHAFLQALELDGYKMHTVGLRVTVNVSTTSVNAALVRSRK